MRLQVIDGDPKQAERLRGWLRRHPGSSLERERRGVWRLSYGCIERTCYTWAELLNVMDKIGREWSGDPAEAKPVHRDSPPDIIA